MQHLPDGTSFTESKNADGDTHTGTGSALAWMLEEDCGPSELWPKLLSGVVQLIAVATVRRQARAGKQKAGGHTPGKDSAVHLWAVMRIQRKEKRLVNGSCEKNTALHFNTCTGRQILVLKNRYLLDGSSAQLLHFSLIFLLENLFTMKNERSWVKDGFIYKAGSGDGTQEVSKPLPSEESLAEADHSAHEEMEANVSVKEAEDDNISVTIQAEDAITLDFDGDDLLETGKNLKITDSEASKSKDGQDAIAPSLEKEDKDYEMTENHKDGKKEDCVKGDPVKKEARESTKKAESGDKDKDTLKKGPSSTGASGQAKSSSKESKENKSTPKDDKGGSISMVQLGSGGINLEWEACRPCMTQFYPVHSIPVPTPTSQSKEGEKCALKGIPTWAWEGEETGKGGQRERRDSGFQGLLPSKLILQEYGL
ncbi:SAFB-like transcription modulator [Varanus komodoensis]|nr:SAFB-like transcription modulator [Varanus komodoensis]